MAISNAIIRPFGCAFQRRAKLVLRIAFRKKLYASIEALQADLDEWIRSVPVFFWPHKAGIIAVN
jgi:hypothetical protein